MGGHQHNFIFEYRRYAYICISCGKAYHGKIYPQSANSNVGIRTGKG